MTRTIEAVYERGVLRQKEPVALADGTIVEVTIIFVDTGAWFASIVPSDVDHSSASQWLKLN